MTYLHNNIVNVAIPDQAQDMTMPRSSQERRRSPACPVLPAGVPGGSPQRPS
jgi:hypothetical protein